MPLSVIIQILLLIPWTEIILLIIQLIQDREKRKSPNPGWTGAMCREHNIGYLIGTYPDMPESRLRWMHDLCYDLLTSCRVLGIEWTQALDQFLHPFGKDHKVIYEPDFDLMSLYKGEYLKKTEGK